MKKIFALLIVAALMLSLMPGAFAEAPVVGSLKAEQQTIRGNSSWTRESYPEIWITPVYSEYIVEGKDAEKYPAKFLRFAPVEGFSPMEFSADYASFINFDTLAQFSYQAMDRASFELFLEKAEKENTLSDGSDGVAIYVIPDGRRGRALIDLKEQFGGTAKLYIEVYDHTGDLTGEQLGESVQAEAQRVMSTMKVEDLNGYWSKGVYSSVTLYDDYAKVSVPVNTTDWTITNASDRSLTALEVVDGEVIDTVVSIDSFYYKDEAKDAKLADGTPYKVHNMEYNSYAFFFLKDGDPDGKCLLIKIETDAASFPEKLEKVYARVTMPKAE